MSSLMNSAMSGLNAAQAALMTTSNNINNFKVAGYTRQTTILGQANSTLGAAGWMGNGVYVAGVQREYDAFITNQLRSAQNLSSGLTTQYEQMSKIDNLLSSSTSSLSTYMQDFFSSLQTLVSNAEDPAARQAVIGKADGLVNQFITTDRYLRDQEKQINTAIVSNVEMINNYSKQIANLNDQISRLTGVGGGVAPNDLLDRRDQLVSELNTIVGVEVNVQDGGTYNVTMANGYSLVQGDRANQLAAVPSNADPSRTTVAFVDSAAGNIEIPEKFITNGSLGGLLKFRSEDLDQTRNALGQMALAFADAFNAQHKQGVDANGDDGGDFFAFGKPSAIGNAKNGGSAVLTPEISNSKQVQATDYKLVYDGSAWQVTRLADNTSFTVTPGSDGKLEFDGMKIAVSGDADRNDSFVVKPVSDAVIDMKVLVRNESQLAMAFEKDSGESDNRNGQALLDLQKEKIVGGSKSFNDAWATLVSDIGNKTSTLKTSSETQEDVVEQLTANQQSSAGVNLDEEYGHLIHYQQFYMASAQVLQTASSLFDALLNIR